MNDFKDYFSQHARQYAASRPGYPSSLIDFLAEQAPSRTLAWDVATGNGQAATSLARHFEQVHATDASGDQVAAATRVARVRYACEPAEACSLDDRCTDLITVAQAAHWFDLDRFYAEARRVSRPGGLLAIWCYGLHTVNEAIDPPVSDYYRSLDAYWPPERRHIEAGYATLDFPFEAMPTPGFQMQVNWTLDEFLGYLRSWSASQRCLRDQGKDPVAPLASTLAGLWGQEQRTVSWPLTLKLARLP